jgi:hypothetical protein
MAIRYDDKGKYFSDVIHKKAVRVFIQAAQYSINGEIYILPGSRLKDDLDQSQKFLPVTHVKVLDQDKKVLWETNFLLLNLEQVIWIIPEEDLLPDQASLENAT